MIASSSSQLSLIVQGRSFTFADFCEAALLACGGTCNAAYFQLLETEISEALFHIELFQKLHRRLNPQNSPEGKLSAWGMSGVEFEEVNFE